MPYLELFSRLNMYSPFGVETTTVSDNLTDPVKDNTEKHGDNYIPAPGFILQMLFKPSLSYSRCSHEV